jgi:hypothetical protein
MTVTSTPFWRKRSRDMLRKGHSSTRIRAACLLLRQFQNWECGIVWFPKDWTICVPVPYILHEVAVSHGTECEVYEECRLLGYENTVRTSQETHYASTTESSQLMLCKIWGTHSSDYEECRLLGYKNTVRTSQETHYASYTAQSVNIMSALRWLWRMPSSGILCRVWLL